MTSGVLIVGASHAGVAIAVGLRDLGFDEPITLAGSEPRLPYDRPPLSKKYLLGAVGEDDILLRSSDFYDQARIEVVTSEFISDIDLDARRALSTSRDFDFEHLALATGASPRRLVVPGHDLPGVVYLRTAEDADTLGALLQSASEVVIVGGGYIGLEAASVISQLGKRVTVVETAPVLVSRAGRPAMSSFLADLHRGNGVTVELGAAVQGFDGGAAGVQQVLLSDGRALPADLVLVGIGIIPTVALANILGLDVDGGIVVDERSMTSNPRVVAAGDATAIKSNRADRPRLMRHESVHSATAQGTAAAHTIMGIEQTSREAPWFWSNQFDVRIQMAGHHDARLHSIVRGDVDSHAFSILYLTEDSRLQAIDCVNRPGDFLAGRRAIDNRQTVDLDRARDASVPLRDAVQ
jgi:3-phenylpropionate/trans-cinnamate dioxygenase ferredoxin reductase subunit